VPTARSARRRVFMGITLYLGGILVLGKTLLRAWA
jgi:hypothetical protein